MSNFYFPTFSSIYFHSVFIPLFLFWVNFIRSYALDSAAITALSANIEPKNSCLKLSIGIKNYYLKLTSKKCLISEEMLIHPETSFSFLKHNLRVSLNLIVFKYLHMLDCIIESTFSKLTKLSCPINVWER